MPACGTVVASSNPDDPVQMRPYSVERLGYGPRVAQCLLKQFRARAEDGLGHLKRLGRVAFLHLLRETLLEIGLVSEMREMHG